MPMERLPDAPIDSAAHFGQNHRMRWLDKGLLRRTRETACSLLSAGRVSRGLLAAFCAALAYWALTWPVIAIDTDLWYHLAFGRQIVHEASIPQTLFYSFLEPRPVLVDYCWLFQVLAFGSHYCLGFFGLILLRAAMFTACLSLLWAFLTRSADLADRPILSAAVFALYALFLTPRFAVIRPFGFSYVMIAAFLLILEHRPRAAFALPFLAALWANLHGVEFPVLFLLCASYAAEILLRRWRGSPPDKEQTATLACLALSMTAVLWTPHGLRLLHSPYSASPLLNQLIVNELGLPRMDSFFSYQWAGLILPSGTAGNLLLGMAIVGALASLGRDVFRPAHLLLLAGAVCLLPRGHRFMYEGILLCLPMVCRCAAVIPSLRAWRLRPHPILSLAAVVVAAWTAFISMRGSFTARDHRYPLSHQGLPEGAVGFLKKAGRGGTVLNHPNQGGYLAWELYPKYSISSDMQGFLSPVTLLYEGAVAFMLPNVFDGLVRRYRPDHILLPASSRRFLREALSRATEYAPVFVDDAGILLTNGRSGPDIVERYRFKALDPFAFYTSTAPALPGSDPAALWEELRRLKGFFQEGAQVNYLLGLHALEAGDPGEALSSAETLLGHHPEREQGYRLKGEVLLRQGRFREAARWFARAIDKDESGDLSLVEKLAECHTRLGEHSRAYSEIVRLAPLLSPSSNLRSFAVTALKAGKYEEGLLWLEFACLNCPPGDAACRSELRATLASVGGGEDPPACRAPSRPR